MGIFSGDNYAGAYASELGNVTLESLMEDNSIDVDFISEDLEEYSLCAIQDINENYGNFMKALALNELNAMETTGNEFVYTEGVLSDMVTSIKNFLKKIWEKIQSLFKRAIMMFDSFSKTDKAFVNKYRKQLTTAMGKNLNDFVFKGYVYTIDSSKLQKAIDGCTAESFLQKSMAGGSFFDTDTLNKMNENYSDYVEQQRGKLIEILGGKASSLNADEFRKELKAVFRNGEEEKDELDKIEVNDMMTELTGSSDAKKEINNMFKSGKKAIDADIKYVDRLSKSTSKEFPLKGDQTNYRDPHDKTKAAQMKKDINKVENSQAYKDIRDGLGQKAAESLHSMNGNTEYKSSYGKTSANEYTGRVSKSIAYASKVCRDSKAVMITIQTEAIAALKERSRQYKACLTKIVYYKPKEEGAYTESGNFVSGSNFLSGIELK